MTMPMRDQPRVGFEGVGRLRVTVEVDVYMDGEGETTGDAIANAYQAIVTEWDGSPFLAKLSGPDVVDGTITAVVNLEHAEGEFWGTCRRCDTDLYWETGETAPMLCAECRRKASDVPV